jgi:CHAT domain-containing protein
MFMRYCFSFIVMLSIFVQPMQAQDCSTSANISGKANLDWAKEAQKAGQLDSAISYYTAAKIAFLEGECFSDMAKAATNLALIYAQQKNTAAYKAEVLVALNLAQNKLPKDDTTAAKIYQIVGTDFYKQQQNDSALIYLQQSKSIYYKTYVWPSYIRVCRTLAIMGQATNDFVLMKNNIDDAYLVVVAQLNSPPEMEAALQQLYGVLYYRTGSYERALEAMQRGLSLTEKNTKTKEDTLTIINYYNNIGLLYLEVGDIVKSEDYSLNAKSLSITLGDFYRAAMINYNIAESFKLREDYEKAYKAYKTALNLLLKTPDFKTNADAARLYINLCNGIAEVAPKLGKNIEALEMLTSNLKAHQKDRFRLEDTYRVLGMYQLKNNNIDLAQEAFQSSLSSAISIYGQTHPIVARAYQYLGDCAMAEQQPKKALAFYERGQKSLFANIEKADIARLPSSENISDKETYLSLLYNRALCHYELNEKEQAYIVAQQAVALIDQFRNSVQAEGSKLFIQRKVMPIYELTLKITFDRYLSQPQDGKNIEDAFYLMEKSKGLLLLDALKSEQARKDGNIPKDLLLEERRLLREIARVEKTIFEAQAAKKDAEVSKLQQQLLQLRQTHQQLQLTLETNYPRYAEIKNKEKIAKLAELRQQLNDNSQIIEYFVGSDFIYVLSSCKEKSKLYQLPKTQQLDNQIVALRTAITQSSLLVDNPKAAYYLYTQNAYAVYEACLAKFIDSTKKEVIIIPDGLLNYIPFEAMLHSPVSLNDSSTNYSFKRLPYLLQRYTIHYNYSASLMLFGRKNQDYSTNGRILGMAPSYKYTPPANPTPDQQRQSAIRTKVKELPGARFELLMLEDYFSGSFYFDSSATEAQLKAEIQDNRYTVLHLAMHGWVDNNRPEYSSLILAHSQDSIEDNMLHAYELPLLDIQSELIVLSACETGFGRLERGEGVTSIGRGFMYAGAGSLVMTLWSINDQASAILMTYFYQHLSQSSPKNKALRLAKLDYIERADSISSHPFFWAGFVLVGDASPLQLGHKATLAIYLAYSTGGIMLLSGGIYYYFRRRKNKKAAANTTI